MKLALISDIHGNFEALSRVFSDIETVGVDAIVCLGDCIGYGPDPEAVVAEMRGRHIPTIMGNHELAICDQNQLKWFNPLAQASLRITLGMLSGDSIDYIRHLPTTRVLGQCLCVHGYPPDSVRTYLFQKPPEALIKTIQMMETDICFVGHTHDLEIVSWDGHRLGRSALEKGCMPLNPEYRYIINVGSVGQPRDGNNNAKYALYDEESNSLEIRFVPYDIAVTVDKIKAAGMPENHARRLW